MIDNSCRTSWKWIPFDIYYRLGDGDGLQGWAMLKRAVANAGHGVGDGDGLQGFAPPVFIFSYYSIFYVLNDRKVKP